NYYRDNWLIPALCLVITYFLKILEVQYSIKIKVIKCNNEIIDIYPQVVELLRDSRILTELSAPNTQA
ncbi:hypothetical protein B0J13DRAFT_459478, partial [Dactylonectria estremocensis]